MFDVKAALTELVRIEGSDLHLKVPAPPMARVYGELVPLGDASPLGPEDTELSLIHI